MFGYFCIPINVCLCYVYYSGELHINTIIIIIIIIMTTSFTEALKLDDPVFPVDLLKLTFDTYKTFIHYKKTCTRKK